ncbi:MAG TPA: hypothetical protein VGV40_13295 [Solirubrobacteraceae bacterium]|nr:hypothetical protein [Solirubrobacteraceae bacterium]
MADFPSVKARALLKVLSRKPLGYRVVRQSGSHRRWVANWTVVADSYEEAHRLADEGVRFALDREDVEIKHFVPAPAA